jgi:hypothetical protein
MMASNKNTLIPLPLILLLVGEEDHNYYSYSKE